MSISTSSHLQEQWRCRRKLVESDRSHFGTALNSLIMLLSLSNDQTSGSNIAFNAHLEMFHILWCTQLTFSVNHHNETLNNASIFLAKNLHLAMFKKVVGQIIMTSKCPFCRNVQDVIMHYTYSHNCHELWTETTDCTFPLLDLTSPMVAGKNFGSRLAFRWLLAVRLSLMRLS